MTDNKTKDTDKRRANGELTLTSGPSPQRHGQENQYGQHKANHRPLCGIEERRYGNAAADHPLGGYMHVAGCARNPASFLQISILNLNLEK